MRTLALVVVDVLLVLVVARALRVVLTRVRQPPVMAEVLAGLVLGAIAAGLFTGDVREVLVVLGEIALVLYLLGVGARLDLRAVRSEGRAVLTVALVAFAVPFAAGAALALALHGGVSTDPPLPAFVLFLGTALAVTAFPVLSRIIDDRGLAERPAGRVALGAAAVQELLVWPLLALAALLAGADGPPWLVVVALTAFLAGALLPRGGKRSALQALDTLPAKAIAFVLLPVFFALPATRVELQATDLTLLAAVLVTAVVAKFGSAALAARGAGLPPREALTVGALMNARGLVELVVLSVGLDAGLVDQRLFAVMVLMALITTFATGPLVDRLDRRGARTIRGTWRRTTARAG